MAWELGIKIIRIVLLRRTKFQLLDQDTHYRGEECAASSGVDIPPFTENIQNDNKGHSCLAVDLVSIVHLCLKTHVEIKKTKPVSTMQRQRYKM